MQALKTKKGLKLIFILIVVILIFISFKVFMLYFMESRFYLLGKNLFPVYTALNKLINKIDKQNFIKDTIVYCDYYTWYDKEHWQRGSSDTPLLGFYDSLDQKIIKKHIEWSETYGIDVFKIEYIPQFDESIINGILNADLSDKINTKVCLMYDSRLRFESIGYDKPPYNFDDPQISDTFIQDMNHIADNYFGSKNYFNINGRPVLWIYVARDFTGNYKKTIQQVRKNLSDKGYDVYLVGDLVFWNYRFEGISSFDAVSCYSAYGGRLQNTAAFAERLKFLYMIWKTAAQISNRDFIPSSIPAYDDTCLSKERISLPVMSGSPEDFNYQLKVIYNFLDSVNISPELNQVSIATFNEHQEGSSVEPSKEWNFKRIEQIPLVFGKN